MCEGKGCHLADNVYVPGAKTACMRCAAEHGVGFDAATGEVHPLATWVCATCCGVSELNGVVQLRSNDAKLGDEVQPSVTEGPQKAHHAPMKWRKPPGEALSPVRVGLWETSQGCQEVAPRAPPPDSFDVFNDLDALMEVESWLPDWRAPSA